MSSKSETVSLSQFFRRFPDEEAAREYLEQNRWAGEMSCSHCGSLSVVPVKDLKPMPYRCRDCRQHFSVRTGTVLAESRLPLHKWLMAIYMMTTARKRTPSTQMARELGVTQKSAGFLAQRIKGAWLGGADGDIGNHLQAGEAFISGKQKNKRSNKKLTVSGGGIGKVAVVGIRDENDQVCATHVADTTAKTLVGIIQDNAPVDATVMTDEFAGHRGLTSKGFTHHTVIIDAGEYARHYCIHTDETESFWAR
jgi:transposase-like protein